MEERFLKHIYKTDTCWIWTGSITKKMGYGQFNIDGNTYRSHRVSYELYKGQIPKGLLVRHICNNPPCVNPQHLEVGTHQDNVNDKMKSGRHQTGINHYKSKLTEEQVKEIRNRADEPKTKLSKEFNTSMSNIYNIIKNKNWKHLN